MTEKVSGDGSTIVNPSTMSADGSATTHLPNYPPPSPPTYPPTHQPTYPPTTTYQPNNLPPYPSSLRSDENPIKTCPHILQCKEDHVGTPEDGYKMNFSIEASIGVGKSTLLKNLRGLLSSASYFPEPVDLWCNTKNGNLLKMFSMDQSKYAFPTQTHIMTTLFQQRSCVPNTEIRIYERSLQSAKNVFQEILFEQGYLDQMECHILDNLNSVLDKDMPKIDGVIYLKASPFLAFERCGQRNDESDRLLKFEYFEMLHEKHERLIENLIKSGKQVVTIDARENQDIQATKAAEWIIDQVQLNKKQKNGKKNFEDPDHLKPSQTLSDLLRPSQTFLDPPDPHNPHSHNPLNSAGPSRTLFTHPPGLSMTLLDPHGPC